MLVSAPEQMRGVGDCAAWPVSGYLPGSTHRLRLGEFPCAIEDFGSRAKEAQRDLRGDREAHPPAAAYP